jgi:enterochelin esterase-like enzyme
MKSGSRSWFSLIMIGMLLVLLQACQAASTPTPQISPVSPTLTVMASPTSTASPEPTVQTTETSCAEKHGHIEQKALDTGLLYKPLQFDVYLPPCYQKDGKYPVLYLLHGQGYNQNVWFDFGLPDLVDEWVSTGRSAPFLMVMPYEQYDLLDPSQTKFDQAVGDVLLKWVDSNYSTCTDRSCRMVDGFSRGAAWAIQIGFEYMDRFATIGAHSPALFNAQTDQIGRWLRAAPANQIIQVYVDYGTKDQWRGSAKEFTQFLAQKQVPYEFHQWEGQHDEIYWRTHIQDYMAWYARRWQYVNR